MVSSRAILLDIEGTTTPISYVYETMFPFARKHLHEALKNIPQEDIAQLKREYDQQSDAEKPAWDPETYLRWLMAKDSKSTALKKIEGKILAHAFEDGSLTGEVFLDVAPALQRWTEGGKTACIFSSGSVIVQRPFFAHTNSGDLAQYLSGFFDTENAGPKREKQSYELIARTLGFNPGEILFLSDVAEEILAATAAGLQGRVVVRPGNKPVTNSELKRISSFAEL